ncbi:MAG: hypothetical protein LBQ76_08630 [Candidatus Fibromonas sp.]|jgi:hypothetical protein|nr:hypothetical protein [Candidatus Fibromonas sp.]
MPSFQKHSEHSRHNLKFLNSFFLKHSNDWAVTAMFYCAVHMAEAILDKAHSTHCRSHQDRSGKLANLDLPSFPMNSYKALERESRYSRYKSYEIFDIEVHKIFECHFQRLIQWFNNQVKPDESLDILPCKEADNEWLERREAKDPECDKCH